MKAIKFPIAKSASTGKLVNAIDIHSDHQEDWICLINLIGGEREGTKIKGKKWNGGNKFGLNIIPAGYRDGYGDFQRMTDMALFWINESIDKKTAWYYSINETGDIEKYFLGDLKGIGHSIRLVKK